MDEGNEGNDGPKPEEAVTPPPWVVGPLPDQSVIAPPTDGSPPLASSPLWPSGTGCVGAEPSTEDRRADTYRCSATFIPSLSPEILRNLPAASGTLEA